MALGVSKVEVQIVDVETRPSVEPELDMWPGHVARELHDQVAQPLISLILQVHELSPDTVEQGEMAKVEDALRSVLRNTRELLVDLRGQGDIRLNFREVLNNEVLRNYATRRAQPPSLQVSSSWPERINGWAAFNLLRIVQEAVSNALRHGRANKVDVILATNAESEALVVVSDDGAGIGDAAEGIGIVGMRERAVILGGSWSATERLHGGTRVEVRVPLTRLA